MIPPTIGRKVWFHPAIAQMETVPANGNFSRRVDLINLSIDRDPRNIFMDATIVYVHNDRLVNLLVTDHVGHQHQMSDVILLHDGYLFDICDAYCKWPPHQVGQAKVDERTAAVVNMFTPIGSAAPGAVETKTYAEGTTATGMAPLPEQSPLSHQAMIRAMNLLAGHSFEGADRLSRKRSDGSIESEIQAKGLTAPRVKPSDLTDNIAHVEIVKHVSPSGQVLRWAVLTTHNGFAVTGRPSASASSENDDQEIGERIAINNARDEMWPLMGYALRERLAQGGAT